MNEVCFLLSHICNHITSNQDDADKDKQTDDEINQTGKQYLDYSLEPCIGFINPKKGNGQINTGACCPHTWQYMPFSSVPQFRQCLYGRLWGVFSMFEFCCLLHIVQEFKSIGAKIRQ